MKYFIPLYFLTLTSVFSQTIDYNTEGGFIAKGSKKVSVDPETYEIRNGELYLFCNAWGNNTLKKRKKNMKGLQKKADINREAIKFN